MQEKLAEQNLKVDRRAWVRHPHNHDISCHPVTAQSGELWAARVHDISAGGIGLVVDRRVEPGALLNVCLQAINGDNSRTILVRVMHERLITAHPGLRWLIGCAFACQLGDEELHALLGSERSAAAR